MASLGPQSSVAQFKSLQTSYQKVKNVQAPESCPFFEEMDALVSAQVAAPLSDGQGTREAEAEKQTEEAEETIEEDSDDDEEDIEIPPGAVITPAPVLSQSPSGKT